MESYSYLRIADLSVKAQSRSGLGLGSGALGILGRALGIKAEGQGGDSGNDGKNNTG